MNGGGSVVPEATGPPVASVPPAPPVSPTPVSVTPVPFQGFFQARNVPGRHPKNVY